MDTQEIITRLGGTAKAAALCNVTPSAVSQWIRSGIPRARLMFLTLARPDIFAAPPVLNGHPGRQPPSPTNILDTIPGHSIVLPTTPKATP
ncbi:Cro/CI family transcriptional regulator [Janthinobacterium sp. PSPC3-1]|uniref:Cro/CI family transcriptional regulator n=1 Tax=Janthinobacterium sp. PSPC3-1 TaxID=2804653 RepID=UPI003CF23207